MSELNVVYTRDNVINYTASFLRRSCKDLHVGLLLDPPTYPMVQDAGYPDAEVCLPDRCDVDTGIDFAKYKLVWFLTFIRYLLHYAVVEGLELMYH